MFTRLATTTLAVLTALVSACAGTGDGSNVDGGNELLGDAGADCGYPSTAVRPMALNQPLWPYSWPYAAAPDDSEAPLDLAEVHCDGDPNRSWSAFDLLLFVSIPAW